MTKKTNGKKRYAVEVEKGETSYESVRFWEVPLELEPNINLSNDKCLVPAEQITLRDFDESTVDNSFDQQVCFYFVFIFLQQSNEILGQWRNLLLFCVCISFYQ